MLSTTTTTTATITLLYLHASISSEAILCAPVATLYIHVGAILWPLAVGVGSGRESGGGGGGGGGVIDYIALVIVCVVLYIETDPAIIPKRPFAEL